VRPDGLLLHFHARRNRRPFGRVSRRGCSLAEAAGLRGRRRPGVEAAHPRRPAALRILGTVEVVLFILAVVGLLFLVPPIAAAIGLTIWLWASWADRVIDELYWKPRDWITKRGRRLSGK
jgi:hypothetical protein